METELNVGSGGGVGGEGRVARQLVRSRDKPTARRLGLRSPVTPPRLLHIPSQEQMSCNLPTWFNCSPNLKLIHYTQV